MSSFISFPSLRILSLTISCRYETLLVRICRQSNLRLNGNRNRPRTFAVLETGIEALYHELAKPGKFALGQVLMTTGASETMLQAQHVPPEFLLRHVHGDWGDLCVEDQHENERSLRLGNRLLSSYRTRREANLWIITEWDRSATTLLLPEEY